MLRRCGVSGGIPADNWQGNSPMLGAQGRAQHRHKWKRMQILQAVLPSAPPSSFSRCQFQLRTAPDA
eukprot:scaffold14443_cov38-Prasinocladus_malaysianus.AAC.1